MKKQEKIEVTVVDIRMPISSMAVFMLKWAVAAIPALTILAVAGILLLGLAISLLPKVCLYFIKGLIWG